MGQLLNVKADGLSKPLSCIGLLKVATVDILDVGEAPLDSGGINTCTRSGGEMAQRKLQPC